MAETLDMHDRLHSPDNRAFFKKLDLSSLVGGMIVADSIGETVRAGNQLSPVIVSEGLE